MRFPPSADPDSKYILGAMQATALWLTNNITMMTNAATARCTARDATVEAQPVENKQVVIFNPCRRDASL